MQTLKNLDHHAYVITGGQAERDILHGMLRDVHGFILEGNPDVYDRQFDSFSVEDARDLIVSHEMKPVVLDGKKIFIVVTNSIGHEAQNAILKLIEEPSSYSHFFIIVPSTHILLPTVRSRVYIIDAREDIKISDEVLQFLKSNYAERLNTVKAIADDIKKEKKTNQDAINFLNDIERALYEKFDVAEIAAPLKTIDECRSFMHDRSPSVKMLLETVALLIPRP